MEGLWKCILCTYSVWKHFICYIQRDTLFAPHTSSLWGITRPSELQSAASGRITSLDFEREMRSSNGKWVFITYQLTYINLCFIVLFCHSLSETAWLQGQGLDTAMVLLCQPVLSVLRDRLLSAGDPLLSMTTALLCGNQTKPCRTLVTEVKIDRTCGHKRVQWDGGHLCVARHLRPLWFLLRFNLRRPLGRLWSENPRHLHPSRLRHLLADQNRPAPVRFVRLDAY